MEDGPGGGFGIKKKNADLEDAYALCPKPNEGSPDKELGERVGKQNEPGNQKANGQKANLETWTETTEKERPGQRKRENREGGKGQEAGRGERTDSQVENPVMGSEHSILGVHEPKLERKCQ